MMNENRSVRLKRGISKRNDVDYSVSRSTETTALLPRKYFRPGGKSNSRYLLMTPIRHDPLTDYYYVIINQIPGRQHLGSYVRV